MRFWTKVWGNGDSLAGEKQIAPLERIGAPYLASQDPGSRTEVKGDFREVFLTADEPPRVRYEFFTSEHVQDNLRTYGRSDDFNPGSVTRAQFRGRSTKTLPMFSSTLAPPNGPDGKPAWTLVPVEWIPAPDYPQPALASWGAWQDGRFFEYLTWPRNTGREMCSSVQAQAPGWNSQCNWQSARATVRLANANLLVSDFGLDVKPTYYTAAGTMTGAPALENDRVWWRRATVQKAGGRTFFVSTDNFGRFQVYPVKDYLRGTDFPYDAIPAEHYQQFMPPYPAWVTLPDVTDTSAINNQWLWAFNADGTRAVTCPFNSVAGDFFKYRSLDDSENFPGAILAEDRTLIADWAATTLPAREDTPGLVELGIKIDVTGPGDMDFSVTFTLLRDEYTGAGGRFIFDAAYSLPDVYGSMGVKPDTLITASIECFCPPGEYDAGPTFIQETEAASIETVQAATNLEAFLVIHANEAAGARELLRQPLSIGLDVRFLTAAGYAVARTVTPQSKYLPQGVGSNLAMADGTTKFFPAQQAVAYGPSAYSATDPALRAIRQAYIGALELRTLSLALLDDNYFTGYGRVLLQAYGRPEVDFTGELGARAARAHPPASQAIPTTATAIYQFILFMQLETDWGCGFSIHPAGHWAACFNGDPREWLPPGSLDLVQPYQGKRTSHAALFNKAFQQTRDEAAFYWDANFPGKGNYDRGSFRTNGVWITF